MAGELEYGIGLDINKLQHDALRVQKQFDKIGDKAVQEGKRIDNAFKQLRAGLAVYFGVEQIGAFAGAVVRTRGEFQKFALILKNTLGSEVKANNALNMVADFAAKTPFQLSELSNAFISLTNRGFQPAREDLVKMGDLASSIGKDFTQLTEAILDAETGEFERLKEFGIKASKQGEKITFTFKQQKTVVDNTAKSIRDYILALGDMKGVKGVMAEISTGIEGKISNLQDTIDKMFNEIGKSNEGFINDALDGASWLVENYQEIGKVLVELTVTYGAYKTALIAINAINKARIAYMKVYNHELKYQTKLALMSGNVSKKKARAMAIEEMSHKKLTAALIKQRIAQLRANAAAKLNIYAAITAAVMALAYAIYKVVTHQTEAEKAQAELNKTFAEFESKARNEELALQDLFAQLKAAGEGTEKYKEIKQLIINQYGSYLKGLDKEKRTLKDINGAYDAITKNMRAKFRQQAMYESIKNANKNYVAQETEQLKKIKEFLTEKKDLTLYYQIEAEVHKGNSFDKFSREINNKILNYTKTVFSRPRWLDESRNIGDSEISEALLQIEKERKIADKIKKEAEERAKALYKAEKKNDADKKISR